MLGLKTVLRVIFALSTCPYSSVLLRFWVEIDYGRG